MKVLIKKLSVLFNLRSYRWLLNCARQFRLPLTANVILIGFGSILSVGSVIISKYLIDLAVAGNLGKTLWAMLIFGLTYLVTMTVSFLSSMITARVNEKMNNALQVKMLERLYRTEWSELNRYHSGDLLTRLTSDISSVVSLWVSSIPIMVSLIVQLVSSFITLMVYDKTLALIAFLLGPVSIVLSFLLGRRIKKIQHSIQTAESRNRSYISESIQNLLVVKSFEFEKYNLNRVVLNQMEKYKWVVKKSNQGIAANMILSLGYWVGYVFAFLMGVIKLSNKTTSFGTFSAFIQLVGQVQAPFSGFLRTIPVMMAGMASVERLMELERLQLEEARQEAASFGGRNAGLSIEHVTFSYTDERHILNEICAEMQPGKITALIGVSGEGKTTVMRLLLALLKPASGSIRILDGERDTVVSSGTRGYFTYVPQGNTLFSGTIADNLRIGKMSATAEEMERVLKAACAWEFVNQLKDHLDTAIGEGGLGLSEGQAQRICIARALLKPSPILLLDEATSALDMETESRIFQNIRMFEPVRTCIVITHRLSVLSSCDAVYRLEGGRLFRHDTEEFGAIVRHGI